MTAMKSDDNVNRCKSETPIDVRRYQDEFKGARAEAEKAAMKYCRRGHKSIRSSDKK